MNENDVVNRVWRTARAIAPNLPETYEEARSTSEPGGIYEVKGFGLVMLLAVGDGYDRLAMTRNGEVIKTRADDLAYAGKTAPLVNMLEEWMDEEADGERSDAVEDLLSNLRRPTRDYGNRKTGKAVVDETGEEYESVADWAEKNGMSKSSGYRLLNGETDRVKGHGLKYADRREK